jgi:hypothetical protein
MSAKTCGRIVTSLGQREPAAHPRKALICRAGLRAEGLHLRAALGPQRLEPLPVRLGCRDPFFQLAVYLDASRFHLRLRCGHLRFQLFDAFHQFENFSFKRADGFARDVDLAYRRGVLALVGGLHQVVLELLMLLLFMLQLAFEPPPRRLRVFEFLFGAEMLFDRFRELALELAATRGKRFEFFRQSLDFDVDVLQ